MVQNHTKILTQEQDYVWKRWSSQVSRKKQNLYHTKNSDKGSWNRTMNGKGEALKSQEKNKISITPRTQTQDYEWDKVKLSSLYQKEKYYKVSKTSNNKQIVTCNCKWIIIKIMNFSHLEKDKIALAVALYLLVDSLSQIGTSVLLVLLSGCLGWLLKVTGGQWLLSCLQACQCH